jgi:hypothetical protein
MKVTFVHFTVGRILSLSLSLTFADASTVLLFGGFKLVSRCF